MPGPGIDPDGSDIRAEEFLSQRTPSSPSGGGHRKGFFAPFASLARKRIGIEMNPARPPPMAVFPMDLFGLFSGSMLCFHWTSAVGKTGTLRMIRNSAAKMP